MVMASHTVIIGNRLNFSHGNYVGVCMHFRCLAANRFHSPLGCIMKVQYGQRL